MLPTLDLGSKTTFFGSLLVVLFPTRLAVFVQHTGKKADCVYGTGCRTSNCPLFSGKGVLP